MQVASGQKLGVTSHCQLTTDHLRAKLLGVTRQTLNNVIHGKSGISPQMAIRLSKAFGSMPETWLRMQLVYDLAQARKDESKIKVRSRNYAYSDSCAPVGVLS